jgi:hypothetical protein
VAGDVLAVGPLKIAPPLGGTLGVGVYDPAAAMARRDATHAGLDVADDSCDEFDARFQILDLAWGADGLPARLWVVYEEHCYRDETAYGELRLNEPAGPAVAVPGVLRWAALEPGASGRPRPSRCTRGRPPPCHPWR